MLKILDKGAPLVFSDTEELTLAMSLPIRPVAQIHTVTVPAPMPTWWQRMKQRITMLWHKVRSWLT